MSVSLGQYAKQLDDVLQRHKDKTILLNEVKEKVIVGFFDDREGNSCRTCYFVDRHFAIHSHFPQEKSTGKKLFRSMIDVANVFLCCYITHFDARRLGLEISLIDLE